MNGFFNGLGRFTVRFRWLIVVVWIVGTFASVHFLPSLASQVNNDNSAFLPNERAEHDRRQSRRRHWSARPPWCRSSSSASAQDGPINAADAEAVARLADRGQERAATSIACSTSAPRPTGTPCSCSPRRASPASVLGPSLDVVNGLTAAFAKADAPAGPQFHLAGTVATNVANQQQSKTAGNQDPAGDDRVHHRAAAVRLPLRSCTARDAAAGGHRAAGRRVRSSVSSALTDSRSPRSPSSC